MKSIDKIEGCQLAENDTFSFRCHPELTCFNQCCRNLNLYLYPYDVIRLKNHLQLTSDQFLDRFVDIVLRPGSYFPSVLLKMSENEEHTCPFLTNKGCSVYLDRPDSCRTFPVEQGVLTSDGNKKSKQLIHLFRPPDFCLGQYEDQKLTPREWAVDQDAVEYNKMTAAWAEIMRLFQNDPWGTEGPNGKKGKVAFMSTYNIDEFRSFIFNSSFLKRYKVKAQLLKQIKKDDIRLMQFGLSWVKFFLFGIKTKQIRKR
jgi:Fe-S-cluster containining protein